MEHSLEVLKKIHEVVFILHFFIYSSVDKIIDCFVLAAEKALLTKSDFPFSQTDISSQVNSPWGY